jgi:thiol-disulfide isomerase/thioredoxin
MAFSFFGLISNDLLAQDAYGLEFQVTGWSDTTVYLGYYYGESTYIKDTAEVDQQGHFSFHGNSSLPLGMYMLVLDKTKVLEFLVGKDQQFALATDTTDYVAHMNVSGDQNNQVFFENIMFNQSMNEKAQPLVALVRDSLSSDDQKSTAQAALKKLNEQMQGHVREVSTANSGLLIGDVMKAQEQVDVPKDLDKDAQFQYYRNHFFDHIDLADDAFLRLPDGLYRKKIEEYLDNLYLQTTDSLKMGIAHIINAAKKNPETYKYAVWNICIKYQTPKYMGQDGLFVYLYDTYFATGEMDFWANESLKNNLKERADQLRKSMLGAQAQNMIMLDENLQRKSLYDIKNKYTVIYFYDPDCGHCKKETPKLNDFYKNSKHDVEVFAVSADTSMVKMRKYIKDNGLGWISINGPRTITPHYQKLYDANTTPTIYLLDEKKRIIAKKLEAVRIEEFLDNYERSH